MELTWNLKHLYINNKEWENDIAVLTNKLNELGRLVDASTNTSESLKQFLKEFLSTYKIIERSYCYKRRCIDLDSSNNDAKEEFTVILNLYGEYQEIENKFHKLLLENKEVISKWINNELLYYKRYVELIFRKNDHLIEDTSIFKEYQLELKRIKDKYQSIINNLHFGMVIIDGEEIEITRENFDRLMLQSDKDTKKQIYETYNNAFKECYEEIGNLYIAKLKNDIKLSSNERYSSLLDKKLFELELSPNMLDNLIEVINDNLATYQEYLKTIQEELGSSKLEIFDLYTKTSESKIEVPFEKAIQIAQESLSIFGSEYLSIINQMLDEGWVDVYPKDNKRLMPSTSISYNGVPYVLMNYRNNFNSLKTYIHEIGHAVNVYLSKNKNNIEYFEFSLFITEVVAKVNELLFFDYVTTSSEDEKERELYLKNIISTMINSIYSQMQLTEFEHTIIKMLENNEEVTPNTLNKVYESIYFKYCNNMIEYNEFIKYGWCKVQHLVLQETYYLYQYTLGLALSSFIVKRIKDKEISVKEYYEFLSLGNTLSTEDSLLKLGINIYDKEYIKNAISNIENKIKELKKQ